MKNVLLVIDAQIDFVMKSGKLSIPGADEGGLKNLCQWIKENGEKLDSIILTQDYHDPGNICFARSWKENPKPFTVMDESDIMSGRYHHKIYPQSYILDYIKAVGKHTIWPPHCIKGSIGSSFPDTLIDVITDCGCSWKIVQKGEENEAEMYSVFSHADKQEPNLKLLKELGKFDRVYVAGFAKDICVAWSVKDMMSYPGLFGKLRFLGSEMTALNQDADMLSIFDEAVSEFGAKWED